MLKAIFSKVGPQLWRPRTKANRPHFLRRSSYGFGGPDFSNSSEAPQFAKAGHSESNVFARGAPENEATQPDVHWSHDEASVSRKAVPKAWLYPELPWGAPPCWEQGRSRGQTFLIIWDITIFICCLYVAGAVPFELGILDALVDDSTCVLMELMDPLNSTRKMAILALLDVTVDVFFTVDIVLHFYQAVWQISKDGSPHWEIIENLPEVRAHYVTKGGLLWDVVGQLPWQYLNCMFPNVPGGMLILRLMRLLKLLRLYRIKSMVQGLYRRFPSCKLLITSFELLLTMFLAGEVLRCSSLFLTCSSPVRCSSPPSPLFLAAHWMCCLYFWVGYPNGWVVKQDIVSVTGDGQDLITEWYYVWITCFYWAITTMATIGYGDISAGTAAERAVAVIVMVIGCALFAYITGRITQILTDLPACEVGQKAWRPQAQFPRP